MEKTQQQSELYLPTSVTSLLPAMVRNELSKLSPQKQEEFLEEYKRKEKSTALAYVFLIFVFALHYGYTKKWGLQVLFWLTFGGLGFWWFIDLFRVPGIVSNYNKDTSIEVMRNLKATSH